MLCKQIKQICISFILHRVFCFQDQVFNTLQVQGQDKRMEVERVGIAWADHRSGKGSHGELTTFTLSF